MSHKYYLEDNIEYLPDTGELVVDGQIENLQSLENKLLLHFIQHPNDLITKDELYKVGWNDRIYGDNPLSKVISNLRAKLKDNPKAPRYIKTVPKKGFIFVSQVREEPPQVTALISEKMGKRYLGAFSKIPFIGSFILLTAIISVSAQFLFHQQGQLQPPQLNSIQSLSTITGQKSEPHISPDGKLVAYTNTASMGGFSRIVIKSVKDNIEKIITGDGYHSRSPKFSNDGQQILYHRRQKSECAIALMELDPQFNVISDQIISQCGQYSKILGLTWGPDDTIFYSDNDREYGPFYIYRLNIANAERKLIAVPEDPNGRGYYAIHYDPVANGLQVLLSDNWFDTQVLTLSLEGEELNRHTVNYPLFSVSSFGGDPVYKTKGNHVNYQQNGVERRLMDSPLRPLFAPYFNDGKSKSMAFVGGDFFNMDLILIDLTNNTESLLVSSNAIQKYPVLTATNKLYFVSNRSGVYQLWQYAQGKLQQLSHFDDNHTIQGIAVSSDEKFIALSINQNTYLYELANSHFQLDQTYLTLKDSINPHFSPDGKNLWVTTKDNGVYQMNPISVADKTALTGIIKNGYIGLFDQQTDEHFIFKNIQPGIWQNKDGQLVWRNNDPLVSSYHSAIIQNGVLTYYSNKLDKLLQLDLATNKSNELTDTSYRYFSSYLNKPNQFIVVRSRFGDTNVFLGQY